MRAIAALVATAAAMVAVVVAPAPVAALGIAEKMPATSLSPEDTDMRELKLFKKKLEPVTNSSVCGLPITTKPPKKATAGRKLIIKFGLKNNVATTFTSVTVKLVLPQGTTFLKAAASASSGAAKRPSLEQQGTEVVWRNFAMKAGQRRKFKVQVLIACGASEILEFRPYTTVGGAAWIIGPVATAKVFPRKRKCGVTPRGPIQVNQNVPALSTSASVPNGVWTSGVISINSAQSVVALPSSRRSLKDRSIGAADATTHRQLTASGFPFALRQQTNSNPSRASATVLYEPSGICNGLLFKDFVLGGFQFNYRFFVDSAPAGFTNVFAPNLRLVTRSPATGEYSDFVWNPAINGQTSFQNWVLSSMNQGTGSNAPWPGASGGTGWGCTLGCYLPGNQTAGATERRSLDTMVQSLLQFNKCSSTFCAINDAIITGIEVVLGPDEPTTVAFTREVSFQAGDCSYKWTFGSS